MEAEFNLLEILSDHSYHLFMTNNHNEQTPSKITFKTQPYTNI